MLNKIIIDEGSQRFVRLSMRATLGLTIAFVVGIALMFALAWQGWRWLASNFDGAHGNNQAMAYVANPLTKIKDFFKPLLPSSSAATVVQPIKVVSEESQVIDVVKRASPAVVSVIASEEVPKIEACADQGTAALPDVPPDLQQFFNLQNPTYCQNGTEFKRVGAGSGFLVGREGYILTNKHVVADEKAAYTVVLNDKKHYGQKVKARVLARDPSNDIAVLRIDVLDDLPFLTLGDSRKLQVGQTAIAIGYSLGQFDNTVSKGVISGLARSIQATGSGLGVEDLRGLIQTDAAINPGNSGGPLLDLGGNVVGISVAMANAQSIGFAIPANIAKNAFQQARTSGVISEESKAFLGVRYFPITFEMQTANKLPYNYGMLVSRGSVKTDLAVVPGSAADKAGLTENDILLEADGQQLNERYILSDALQDKKPGDQMEFKVYHKGEVKTVRVTLDKK